MQRSWPILAGSLLLSLCAERALAFCGFYVAKADTTIFNNASQVAIARDGDRTTMTMANDFRGDLKEFAVVIPVPTVVKREQIAVAEKALLDHLDAYSSPRLVEYHDPNPCAGADFEGLRAHGYAAPAAPAAERGAAAVRVLHDLRPEDDARRARRPPAVRAAGGRRRVLRAVQAVPAQRPVVVARSGVAARAADRPLAAGASLRLEPIALRGRKKPCAVRSCCCR